MITSVYLALICSPSSLKPRFLQLQPLIELNCTKNIYLNMEGESNLGDSNHTQYRIALVELGIFLQKRILGQRNRRLINISLEYRCGVLAPNYGALIYIIRKQLHQLGLEIRAIDVYNLFNLHSRSMPSINYLFFGPI